MDLLRWWSTPPVANRARALLGRHGCSVRRPGRARSLQVGGDPAAPATDYDLACDVEGALGVIPVGSGDFPLDTDVQAAIRGIELRLEHPDGTVVRARM
jgi:hypothetical protein